MKNEDSTVLEPDRERHVRELGVKRQLMYYSQYLYRFVFAYLLFLYMRHEGITGGVLPEHAIAAAMVAYCLATAAIMVLARGYRLTVPLQRAGVAIDLIAMVIGVPHDPHPGLPVLFVYYMAFADLGLRYQYRRYLESMAMGGVAVALVALLRAQTGLGLTLPDIWSLTLFVIIILHGLQVFAGRDQARRALQEAQERLTLALQSPGLGAWSTANPLHEIQIDGHIRGVLGLDREGAYSMAEYVERLHADDRPRVIAQWVDFVHHGGTDYEDHYRIYRADGEICTVSSRAKALRDRDGRAVSVSGMVWDLTEQKRQQAALERMEERYRLATWSARVGVWIWHVGDDRFEHDDTMNRLFDLQAGTRVLRVEEVLQIVHPEDRDAFRARLQRALESKDSEFFDEVRVRLPGGEEFVVHSRATIYRDADGRALRLAGANWDATKLAQARRALEEKTRELEISNRELDDFSYIASHDLKEPLRGISNYAAFLQQDYVDRLDEPGREMLQRIRDQARRMETLIQELLNIARLGRTQLAVEEVDLHEVLEQILQSLEYSIREKNVQLRIPRRLPRLVCDRVRVGELLRNLLTNAIKYNDKPYRWVEVGCHDAGPELRFHVRDNGIGIRPEHHERVFNLFERLHRRDAYGGGTGVGLTIAQKTVQMHGGRIWLDSDVGHGTTFHFTLPSTRKS